VSGERKQEFFTPTGTLWDRVPNSAVNIPLTREDVSALALHLAQVTNGADWEWGTTQSTTLKVVFGVRRSPWRMRVLHQVGSVDYVDQGGLAIPVLSTVPFTLNDAKEMGCYTSLALKTLVEDITSRTVGAVENLSLGTVVRQMVGDITPFYEVLGLSGGLPSGASSVMLVAVMSTPAIRPVPATDFIVRFPKPVCYHSRFKPYSLGSGDVDSFPKSSPYGLRYFKFSDHDPCRNLLAGAYSQDLKITLKGRLLDGVSVAFDGEKNSFSRIPLKLLAHMCSYMLLGADANGYLPATPTRLVWDEAPGMSGVAPLAEARGRINF